MEPEKRLKIEPKNRTRKRLRQQREHEEIDSKE